MGIMERYRSYMREWMGSKKLLKYARARCEILSECTRQTEEFLNSRGARYSRLIDPDPHMITAMSEPFYEQGKFLGIIELRDELSRAFYLIESDIPVNFGELPGVEFTIAFRVKKKEGLMALIMAIYEGKIGGARHKHRSMLNFLTSFFGSLFLSTMMNFKSYWVQLIITLTLTVLLFLILDYPFPVLYFKGVEVVSNKETSMKVFVLRDRMWEKREN
ncbi:hypothetical protein [Thermococcus barossii]|nr:hypothetical protein [Thermococcus barossii]